eukprot:11250378-Karenia_brevis.AAC.1
MEMTMVMTMRALSVMIVMMIAALVITLEDMYIMCMCTAAQPVETVKYLYNELGAEEAAMVHPQALMLPPPIVKSCLCVHMMAGIYAGFAFLLPRYLRHNSFMSHSSQKTRQEAIVLSKGARLVNF